jgi:hypothetical protein
MCGSAEGKPRLGLPGLMRSPSGSIWETFTVSACAGPAVLGLLIAGCDPAAVGTTRYNLSHHFRDPFFRIDQFRSIQNPTNG